MRPNGPAGVPGCIRASAFPHSNHGLSANAPAIYLHGDDVKRARQIAGAFAHWDDIDVHFRRFL